MNIDKSRNDRNGGVYNFLPNTKSPPRVVITEATGYISRSLAYRLMIDRVFGPNQEIILTLYDIPEKAVFLEGIAIEITACAPNLLREIICTANPSDAFSDADYIFCVGKARDYNFSQIDLHDDPFFKDTILSTKENAKAIATCAKKSVKIITLGNTAARIISEYVPMVPKENITACSLALLKIVTSRVARITNRKPSEVKNVIIWGTNSRHVFPYLNYAKFSDGKSVQKEIDNDTWCKKILPQYITASFHKNRYRISESLALAEHCKYLIQGTPEGEWTCMSVYSDGSYGVTPKVFFSFPVYCKNGRYKIVQGLQIDDYLTKIFKQILIVLEEKVVAALKICNQANLLFIRRSTVRKSIMKST